MTAEQWDVLRRIAERGLKMAQEARAEIAAIPGGPHALAVGRSAAHRSHLDLWQHMIDELQRGKP